MKSISKYFLDELRNKDNLQASRVESSLSRGEKSNKIAGMRSELLLKLVGQMPNPSSPLTPSPVRFKNLNIKDKVSPNQPMQIIEPAEEHQRGKDRSGPIKETTSSSSPQKKHFVGEDRNNQGFSKFMNNRRPPLKREPGTIQSLVRLPVRRENHNAYGTDYALSIAKFDKDVKTLSSCSHDDDENVENLSKSPRERKRTIASNQKPLLSDVRDSGGDMPTSGLKLHLKRVEEENSSLKSQLRHLQLQLAKLQMSDAQLHDASDCRASWSPLHEMQAGANDKVDLQSILKKVLHGISKLQNSEENMNLIYNLSLLLSHIMPHYLHRL